MANIVIWAIHLILLAFVLWEAGIGSICKTGPSLRHSSTCTLNRLYTNFAVEVVPNYTLPTLDPLFLSEVMGLMAKYQANETILHYFPTVCFCWLSQHDFWAVQADVTPIFLEPKCCPHQN